MAAAWIGAVLATFHAAAEPPGKTVPAEAGADFRVLRFSPRAGGELERLRQLEREERWREAAEGYRELLRQCGDQVVGLTTPTDEPGRTWIGVRSEIAGRLQAWPQAAAAVLAGDPALSALLRPAASTPRSAVATQPCRPVDADPAPAGRYVLWSRQLAELRQGQPDRPTGRPLLPAESRPADLIDDVAATIEYLYLLFPDLLVCLDIDTGRMRWSLPASSLPEEPDLCARFEGPAAWFEGDLYVTGLEYHSHLPEIRVHAARIDAGAGQVIWCRPVVRLAKEAAPAAQSISFQRGHAPGIIRMIVAGSITVDFETADGTVARLHVAGPLAPEGQSFARWGEYRGTRRMQIGEHRLLSIGQEHVTMEADGAVREEIRRRLGAGPAACDLHLVLLQWLAEEGAPPEDIETGLADLAGCLQLPGAPPETWRMLLEWPGRTSSFRNFLKAVRGAAGALDAAAEPEWKARWRLAVAAGDPDPAEACRIIAGLLADDHIREACLTAFNEGRPGLACPGQLAGEVVSSPDRARFYAAWCNLCAGRPDPAEAVATGMVEEVKSGKGEAETVLPLVIRRYPFSEAAGEAAALWIRDVRRLHGPLSAAILAETLAGEVCRLRGAANVAEVGADYLAAGAGEAAIHWSIAPGEMPVRPAPLGEHLVEIPADPEAGQEDAAQWLIVPDEVISHGEDTGVAVHVPAAGEIRLLGSPADDAAPRSIAWPVDLAPLWSATVGTLYLLASRGQVTAMDGPSGSRLWQRATGEDPEETTAGRSSSNPIPTQVLWPSLLVRVHRGRAAVAVRTLDGQIAWRAELDPPVAGPLAIGPGLFAWVTKKDGWGLAVTSLPPGPPTIHLSWPGDDRPEHLWALPDGNMLAAGPARILKLDRRTGEILWHRPMPVDGRPGLLRGRRMVYFAQPGGQITAITHKEGELAWTRPVLDETVRFLTGDGDSLAVVGGNRLRILKAVDGAELVSRLLPAGQRIEQLAWTAENLVVVTSEPAGGDDTPEARRVEVRFIPRGGGPTTTGDRDHAILLGDRIDLRRLTIVGRTLAVQDGERVRLWRGQQGGAGRK